MPSVPHRGQYRAVFWLLNQYVRAETAPGLVESSHGHTWERIVYEPRLNDTSKGDSSVDTEPVRGHCAGALFLRHTRPLARPALFMLSQPRIRHLLSLAVLCCSFVPASWSRCGIRCIQSQRPQTWRKGRQYRRTKQSSFLFLLRVCETESRG